MQDNNDITTRPVIFIDGSAYFSDLAKKYVQHKNGYFILAPSGTGKTYYTTHQSEKNWIDGDDLWPETMADTTGDEWDYDFDVVQEMNNRCDVITYQAKKCGFWVIGASNNWLQPDAIVLPPWEDHKKLILKRQSTKYDGGATEKDFNGVLAHRKWIELWTAKGVPCFESIAEATTYLEKQ